MIRTAIIALALAFAVSPATALTTTVSNPATITINDGGEVVSNLTVAGVAGNVTGLSLTLNGLSHSYPDDLVFGLVNQTTGLGLVFLSGVGGSTGVANTTLTFSDAAASQLPESFVGGGITSGTYLPSNFDSYMFTPSIGVTNVASFADFLGTSANGVWALYAVDVFAADTGTISGGWSLNFTTDAAIGAVPEPMTWSLMIVGFGLAGAMLRRRRNMAARFAI